MPSSTWKAPIHQGAWIMLSLGEKWKGSDQLWGWIVRYTIEIDSPIRTTRRLRHMKCLRTTTQTKLFNFHLVGWHAKAITFSEPCLVRWKAGRTSLNVIPRGVLAKSTLTIDLYSKFDASRKNVETPPNFGTFRIIVISRHFNVIPIYRNERILTATCRVHAPQTSSSEVMHATKWFGLDHLDYTPNAPKSRAYEQACAPAKTCWCEIGS